MSECEVSNAEFRLFMNTSPGITHSSTWYDTGTNENFSAESVSWNQAAMYCNWKTVNTPGLTAADCCYADYNHNGYYFIVAGKNGYRLSNKNPNGNWPYKSEWVYACQAGTDSTWLYYWGAAFDNAGPPAANGADYCWYDADSLSHPNDVGWKIPNLWGLYDMSGNVCEWTNEDQGNSNYWRSVRGGSWYDSAAGLASEYLLASGYFDPATVNNAIGFRLVRTKPIVP